MDEEILRKYEKYVEENPQRHRKCMESIAKHLASTMEINRDDYELVPDPKTKKNI